MPIISKGIIKNKQKGNFYYVDSFGNLCSKKFKDFGEGIFFKVTVRDANNQVIDKLTFTQSNKDTHKRIGTVLKEKYDVDLTPVFAGFFDY